jgi:uncharacterized protein DUF5615
VDVVAVDGSALAGLDDRALLRLAVADGRILVTYNNGHFAPLMTDLLRERASFPGIVFVDRRTIPTSDVGGLARSIARLARRIEDGTVDASGGIFLGRA